MAKLVLMSPERLFHALAFSDVGGYTAGRIGCAGVVAQRELDRNIGMQPVLMRRLFFIFHCTVPFQNLKIVCSERIRKLSWENFVVRMPNNLFIREMKQPLK